MWLWFLDRCGRGFGLDVDLVGIVSVRCGVFLVYTVRGFHLGIDMVVVLG